MMKLKLRMSYDGANYSGWQVQKNAPTIQKKLQDAVESVYGRRYSVTGCSRTDSGVHAKDYCCTLEIDDNCSVSIPVEKVPLVLNRFLPDDISVFGSQIVSDEFHPRYDVIYKEYEYIILNSDIKDPFLNNKAFLYSKKLDVSIMDMAAKMFVGTHDFQGFMSSGSSVVDTVRTIKYFSVKREGDIVKLNVAADGFLYNMVRILVGTLIEISEGKIKLDDLDEIIRSKDRGRAGFTAPPYGLYLNKVVY